MKRVSSQQLIIRVWRVQSNLEKLSLDRQVLGEPQASFEAQAISDSVVANQGSQPMLLFSKTIRITNLL